MIKSIDVKKPKKKKRSRHITTHTVPNAVDIKGNTELGPTEELLYDD